MRRFDVVIRTRGTDGVPLIRGGRVSMPGPLDPRRLAALIDASDQRDAPRSLGAVDEDVFDRSGGNEPPEPERLADANANPSTDASAPTQGSNGSIQPGDPH